MFFSTFWKNKYDYIITKVAPLTMFNNYWCSHCLGHFDGLVGSRTRWIDQQVNKMHCWCKVNTTQCSFEVFYEPTDVDKASKPFFSDSWRALACISPNLQELRAIVQTLGHPVPAGENRWRWWWRRKKCFIYEFMELIWMSQTLPNILSILIGQSSPRAFLYSAPWVLWLETPWLELGVWCLQSMCSTARLCPGV